MFIYVCISVLYFIFFVYQLKNSLTMAVDLFVKKTELHTFKRNNKSAAAEEFTKLGTVEPRSMYQVPLYAAYHCAIYVCPTGLP